MTPGKYNFKDHYNGDKFKALEFQINVNGNPLVLTGADINMQVRLIPGGRILKQFKVGEGITITDGNAGEFEIDEVEALRFSEIGNLKYDIEIIINDRVSTYIAGNWKIVNDITRVNG